MTDAHTIMAFCNGCSRRTRHDELHTHAYDHEDGSSRRVCVTWTLRKCRGCEEVHASHAVEYVGFGPPEVRYYPSREMRRMPKWSEKLSSHGQSLLREVYSAMHSGSLCLATMGARALLDLAFLASVGDCGNFREKLDQMIKKGFLADQNRHILEAALDTGNAASHRGHTPELPHFEGVMDIVEHLLEEVYYLRGLGDNLKQAVPPRSKGLADGE